MADADGKPRIPSALKKLVLDYQNTCVFMWKTWRRLMLVLAFAFPAAFYLREASIIPTLVNAVGFWVITAILSRFLVFEFRLLRAGWVAKKIDKRRPAEHPSRQAVIDWIREHNDGNFLNSLLKKLDSSPHPPELSAIDYDPATFINGVLGKLGKQEQQTTQTYVYSSQTQILNEDGEWVTVDSYSSEEGGAPPEAVLQQAFGQAEPPQGFKPIPIAAPTDGKKRKKKRKRRRRKFMPLDPEAFEAEATGSGAEGGKRR
jgi:hypothetical protein